MAVNDVTLQTAADHLLHWAHNNGMMIDTNKTKELTRNQYASPPEGNAIPACPLSDFCVQN